MRPPSLGTTRTYYGDRHAPSARTERLTPGAGVFPPPRFKGPDVAWLFVRVEAGAGEPGVAQCVSGRESRVGRATLIAPRMNRERGG